MLNFQRVTIMYRGFLECIPGFYGRIVGLIEETIPSISIRRFIEDCF